MMQRRWRRFRSGVLITLVLSMTVAETRVARVSSRTIADYERFVAEVEAKFTAQVASDQFLQFDLNALRAGGEPRTPVVQPGVGDGILDVHDGLIHHWRGAVFMAGVTLDRVLAVVQDFPAYPNVYPGVIGARVFDRDRDAQGDRFRVLIRVEQRTAGRLAVLDLWRVVSYRYPRRDRAAATSDADCVREVEDAGAPDERLLSPGTGSGYLWRTNTFAKYLEQDGGVYVELENLGLSREFPRFLRWLIEPLARRLGRNSVERSLVHLRTAVQARPSEPEKVRARSGSEAGSSLPAFWCMR